MSDIVKLDDFRPHFQATDPVTGSVHVLPVVLVSDMVYGRTKIDSIEEWQPMVRALLFALLQEVAG
ncbi:hypothetical protein KC976_04705 [Candidatus Saccharibacteria bacterium]|nr:hypothetical protein [Candidatus Saccharibacteria bacterium]